MHVQLNACSGLCTKVLSLCVQFGFEIQLNSCFQSSNIFKCASMKIVFSF